MSRSSRHFLQLLGKSNQYPGKRAYLGKHQCITTLHACWREGGREGGKEGGRLVCVRVAKANVSPAQGNTCFNKNTQWQCKYFSSFTTMSSISFLLFFFLCVCVYVCVCVCVSFFYSLPLFFFLSNLVWF